MNPERQPEQPRENSKMSTSELLERLKPYPVLQSLALEKTTDQKWEEYVGLPTETPEIDSSGNEKPS